jgi:hypothetical protein
VLIYEFNFGYEEFKLFQKNYFKKLALVNGRAGLLSADE